MIVAPDVEYVGEINDLEKSAFLSGAVALLVPIAWPEPFGLAMIEALACGAPVIAYDRGSVREIVEPGVTGFVVENETEAAAAAEQPGCRGRRSGSGSRRASPRAAWPRTISTSIAA